MNDTDITPKPIRRHNRRNRRTGRFIPVILCLACPAKCEIRKRKCMFKQEATK